VRALDKRLSTRNLTIMWWAKDKQGILERLDALESGQHSNTIEDTLGSHQKQIVALGAVQQASEQSSVNLRDKVQQLTLAVAEGIENVARKERRIAATLARSRKELRERGYEDPGLEAEAAELREVDGTRGDEQGVLPLRKEVEEPEPTPSSVEGVPLETLQRVRGLR